MRKTIIGLLALVCCCSVATAVHAQELAPEKRRKTNAFIGFGVGITGYWPDTASLNAAFTAIEDFYRDQGWLIPGHAALDASPLITYSLRLQLASPIGLVLDAARRTGDDELDALSATLLVDFGRIRDTRVRPYIGAGVTDVSFEFTRKYEAPISPNEGSGFSTLDHITATGGETGANFVGGLQFEFLHARLIFQGAYWWIPEISNDFGTGVETTVNLSSFQLGAHFMLTLP